jgi:hypothetical protein
VTFTAKFRGECTNCGGDVKDTECDFDGTNGIVHVQCPLDGLTLMRPVCPVHFTELPVSGVCGDCE